MSKFLVKTSEQIEILRLNNQLVSDTLAELALHVFPGVATIELDRIAEAFIRDHGAKPGFKGYEGFPYTLCVSVNDVVVHGFPSGYELRDGDIVSIDCGTYMHGLYGDSAFTFAVGEISSEATQLLRVTRESLELGIDAAVNGANTGDIGYAVQKHAESFGYGVVREMVGHGLGTNMHERPEVPNYGKKGHGAPLLPGMVLCVEPMITAGARHVYQEDDGWTIRTRDNSLAAHFEKAIAIQPDGIPLQLTSYEKIDKAIETVKR